MWSTQNYLEANFSFTTFKNVTIEQLRQYIFSLAKRNKPEIICGFLKKHLRRNGLYLSQLSTLEYGCYPEVIKLSSVIPIPKIRDIIKACNFSPKNILLTLEL